MKDLKELSEPCTTIDYYNKNRSDFVCRTQTIEFHEIQDLFLKYVKPNGMILDFGCGSGRDTRYFLKKGYKVDPVDGSEEMCRAASDFTGLHVRQMMFKELDENDRYDGIWACASILHIARQELPQIFRQMRKALKEDGVLYASFKYGEYEGWRNGRYFTDLTEQSLLSVVGQVSGFETMKLWLTEDVRGDRKDQKWINIILKKADI